MAYEKQLGILVQGPEPGGVNAGLVPPLSAEAASRLYAAFLRDLLERLGRLKKIRGTVFCCGGKPAGLSSDVPESYTVTLQEGHGLGERLQSAFAALLGGESRSAVVIGSDSPDIPVQYIKRAYIKLKHKDVVLGPAAGGGCYLIGAKSVEPALFDGIDREGGHRVLERVLVRLDERGLSLSLLPLWYGVNTPASLDLLAALIRARRLERSFRLPATEAVLAEVLENI